MTCTECGREVHNWPTWLANSSLKVRCEDCSGSGFNPVQPRTERHSIASMTEIRDRWDVAEAA